LADFVGRLGQRFLTGLSSIRGHSEISAPITIAERKFEDSSNFTLLTIVGN
jgi:hypothetical protein